jgi:hypothetical protein
MGFTLDANLLNLLRFPIDGLNVADSSLLVKRKESAMHRPGRKGLGEIASRQTQTDKSVYMRTHLDEKAHTESMEGLPSSYCKSSLDDLVESERTGVVSKHGAYFLFFRVNVVASTYRD